MRSAWPDQKSAKEALSEHCELKFVEIFGQPVPNGWREAWWRRSLVVKGIDDAAVEIVPTLRRGPATKARDLIGQFGIGRRTWDLDDHRLTPTLVHVVMTLDGGEAADAYSTSKVPKLNNFNTFVIACFRRLDIRLSPELKAEIKEDPELADFIPRRSRLLSRTDLAALAIIINPNSLVLKESEMVLGPSEMLRPKAHAIGQILARAFRGSGELDRRSGEPLEIPWPRAGNFPSEFF